MSTVSPFSAKTNRTNSSYSASFPTFMWGSMYFMRRLHSTRSCASSPDNSLSDRSLLMSSNHLRFGLPLLLPGTSITITLLPTHSCSPLKRCPYYFNPLSGTFVDISSTFDVPLILSLLILSSLVTPLTHLNILISATSNFFSCVLSSLPKYRHRTPLLVLQPSCIVSLDSQTYSSVTQNPRYPLPVFPS